MRRFTILLMTLLFLPVLGSFAQEEEATEPQIVEVTALDYAFAAPDEIPSGWVTFRLNNEKSKEVHEIDLGLLPEGVTYADFRKTIPVWDMVTERTQAGELVGPGEVYAAAGPELPKWFGDFRNLPYAALSRLDTSPRKPCILSPAPMPCSALLNHPKVRHISPWE